ARWPVPVTGAIPTASAHRRARARAKAGQQPPRRPRPAPRQLRASRDRRAGVPSPAKPIVGLGAVGPDADALNVAVGIVSSASWAEQSTRQLPGLRVPPDG